MRYIVDFLYFLRCIASLLWVVCFGVFALFLDFALWAAVGGLLGIGLVVVVRSSHHHH